MGGRFYLCSLVCSFWLSFIFAGFYRAASRCIGLTTTRRIIEVRLALLVCFLPRPLAIPTTSIYPKCRGLSTAYRHVHQHEHMQTENEIDINVTLTDTLFPRLRGRKERRDAPCGQPETSHRRRLL